jgi:hypothetical protein
MRARGDYCHVEYAVEHFVQIAPWLRELAREARPILMWRVVAGMPPLWALGALVIVVLLTVGCAAPKPPPAAPREQVYIATPVPCKVPLGTLQRPPLRFTALPPAAPLDKAVQALAADLQGYLAYAERLEVVVRACGAGK